MKATTAHMFVMMLATFAIVGCRRDEPVSAAKLVEFKASANLFALESREDISQMADLTDRFRALAEQAASNPQYDREAPREAAISYRLYAGNLLVRVSGASKAAKANDALPWLKRAVLLGASFKDFPELQGAERFFTEATKKTPAAIDSRDWAQHMIRVCMVEATPEQFGEIVSMLLGMVRSLDKKQAGGSSINEEVAFLEGQGKGEKTIKLGLMAFKFELQKLNPGRQVGSDEASFILPQSNGNTCIRYTFMNGTTPHLIEWEVNKTKGIVIPKTEGARVIMELIGMESAK